MTTADNAAQQWPYTAREGLLARYSLLFYILFAYLGTWVVCLSFLLSAEGLGLMWSSTPIPIIVMGGLGSFTGTALGAFIMMSLDQRQGGRTPLVAVRLQPACL